MEQLMLITKEFRKLNKLNIKRRLKDWVTNCARLGASGIFKNNITKEIVYLISLDIEEHWRTFRKEDQFIKKISGTIAHEIETHAFTAMNGALQPYKIFQRGLADYLMTEEGLAVYNQEKTESSETIKKYWPASSVIGIYRAMHGSFADTYAEVLK